MRELLLVVFSFLFLSSCEKYKPAQEAFFLTAGDIQVKTTATQGTGSHKITDLGLYVNGMFQGTYPVGNLMPVVSNGFPVRINLLAGIKNNGISDTRLYWPFYKPVQFDTVVESGKTIVRNVVFEYLPNTTFTLNETFDAAGINVMNSPIADAPYKIVDQGPETMEGRCALLEVKGSQQIAQIETSGSGYVLPHETSDIYAELNYKGNVDFEAGLIGSVGELRPALHIKAQPDWNKIYIQLATTINTPPYSPVFKLYFRVLKKDGTEPKVFLDNIKIVHFK